MPTVHTPAQPALSARAVWRDGIKRSNLTPKARLVALVMADYWPTDGNELWCADDTLIAQTGLSRATVYRAREELQSHGWLVQSSPSRQNRSPRYFATAGTQRSHSKTPGVSRRDPEVSHSDPTPQNSSPESTHGSSDPDIASRPKTSTTTPRERRYQWNLLAQHMANYQDSAVDTVFTWLTQGTHGSQADKPGSFARRLHAKPTSEDGVSEWQGLFRRLYSTSPDDPLPYPTVGNRPASNRSDAA